jgi:phosphatidylinositol alpha-1,6-mannosyltransferase
MIDNKQVENIKNKYNLYNKKILLTVARLVESKGIDQVIKALPQVWQEISNLVYIVIGDGNFSNQLSVISNQICKEKNKIIFTGAVPHDELPNFYALADAFILTPRKNSSCDTESFGIVYLEAQEFNLPIIASNIGGIKEALKNYNNFILVDPKNISQITNAVINYCTNL